MHVPGPGFRLAAAALALSPAAAPASADAEGFQFREAALGTHLNLIVNAASAFAAHRAALAVRAEIDRLDAVLNARRPDSELSALNRADRFAASEHLFTVVAAAERWRALSGGAFSGRLGAVSALWRAAGDEPPSRRLLQAAARAADRALVVLDEERRAIQRPAGVTFDLDALAKGYVIDRAAEAGLAASPGVRGLLLDIGGDMRAVGESCDAAGWAVGIPDPLHPADNAALVEMTRLSNGALAGSGRGPRDRRIGGRSFSPTLSSRTGWPIAGSAAAHATGATALEADALASACLSLSPDEAIVLADCLGAAVRVTGAGGAVLSNALWSSTAEPAPRLIPAQAGRAASWPKGWQALATFTAPRRQLIRDPDFRSPYMALWITDLNNKPVRTLLLVGKFAGWQRDNFIWWNSNPGQTDRLVATRAMGTSGLGIYNVFWDGVDDQNRVVPAGRYILHVETSRERGKHTYRNMNLDFSKAVKFKAALPPTEEGGGLGVSYDHY